MWARVTGFHVLRKRTTTAHTALFIKIKKPTSNSNYCDGSADEVCCLIVPRIQIEVKTIVMLLTDN